MLYTRSPVTSAAIGRSPVGVAMSVSGAAHRHSGAQPGGQLPVSDGGTQPGPLAIGPFSVQQIVSAPQHCEPQQTSASVHAWLSHGATAHVP